MYLENNKISYTFLLSYITLQVSAYYFMVSGTTQCISQPITVWWDIAGIVIAAAVTMGIPVVVVKVLYMHTMQQVCIHMHVAATVCIFDGQKGYCIVAV